MRGANEAIAPAHERLRPRTGVTGSRIGGTGPLRWWYIATIMPARAIPVRPYAIGAAFASRNGVPLSARSRSSAEGRQRAPYCSCHAAIWS